MITLLLLKLCFYEKMFKINIYFKGSEGDDLESKYQLAITRSTEITILNTYLAFFPFSTICYLFFY